MGYGSWRAQMPKKIDPKLPRQVKKYLRFWRRVFCLPNWPVFYQDQDKIEDRWGSGAVAAVSVDTGNAEVKVLFRGDLVPSDDIVSRVICHEMLHWLTDEMDTFVEERLTKRDYRTFVRLLETVLETIALTLVAPERKKPSPDSWFVGDQCEH